MKIAVIVLWVWLGAPEMPCYEHVCWGVSGHFRTTVGCVQAGSADLIREKWVCLPHGLLPHDFREREV